MFSRKVNFILISGFVLFSAFFFLLSLTDIANVATDKLPENLKPQAPVEKPKPEAEAPKPPKEPAKEEPKPEPPKEDPKPAEPEAEKPKEEPAKEKKPRPAGCGIPHDFAGKPHRNFTLQSDGRERTYWVSLPDDYDANTETPAVIGFAPKGTEPVGYDRYTGFSNPKVNPGMITVWPVAIDLSWEGAPSAPKGVNDKLFVSDLIHQLKEDYCMGPILATGHSNGAGFVGSLACSAEHGKEFAGFAPVAGTFYTDIVGDENCEVTDEIRPIFEIHGDADEFAKYWGGTKDEGKPIPSIPEWINRWAVRNGCDMKPIREDLGPKVEKSYTCDGKKDAVKHVKVKGHGHGWIGIDRHGKYMDGFMTPDVVEWFNGLTKSAKDDKKE